jgi:hypothetical protein
MTTTKTNPAKKIAQEFLALPAEALPAVRFLEEDDSWAGSAWTILGAVARGEGVPVDLCGTRLVLTSSRPGHLKHVL